MAKLGTKKRPAVVRVHSQAKADEILALCESRGWQVIVGIEPDEPEDISDVKRLLRKEKTAPRPGFVPRYSRNDFCPCGSEKKYKNCCWDKDHPE